MDDVTRECLAAIPDTSISGRRVVRELTTLIERRGKPRMIVSDNGTELTCNAVLGWCSDHKINWHYIAPRSWAFLHALPRNGKTNAERIR